MCQDEKRSRSRNGRRRREEREEERASKTEVECNYGAHCKNQDQKQHVKQQEEQTRQDTFERQDRKHSTGKTGVHRM
eukprot:458272-Hanusia_phi.AAC.1